MFDLQSMRDAFMMTMLMMKMWSVMMMTRSSEKEQPCMKCMRDNMHKPDLHERLLLQLLPWYILMTHQCEALSG